MQNISLGPLVFYPSYCFDLSPTFKTWARLTATNVHALESRTGFEGQNIYFYSNHPIKWIRLVGVIVALDVYPNRITMILDDSSGFTIEVFCRKDTSTVASTLDTSVDSYGGIKLNQAPVKKDHGQVCTTSEGKVNLKMFEVGSIVKIKGGISEFRGEKQVTLERISLVRTTSEEATAWAENAAFYKNVMCKPWVVTERDQRRAKKKAAGIEQEREAKKWRKQRRKGLEVKRVCGALKRDDRSCATEKKREP